MNPLDERSAFVEVAFHEEPWNVQGDVDVVDETPCAFLDGTRPESTEDGQASK